MRLACRDEVERHAASLRGRAVAQTSNGVRQRIAARTHHVERRGLARPALERRRALARGGSRVRRRTDAQSIARRGLENAVGRPSGGRRGRRPASPARGAISGSSFTGRRVDEHVVALGVRRPLTSPPARDGHVRRRASSSAAATAFAAAPGPEHERPAPARLDLRGRPRATSVVEPSTRPSSHDEGVDRPGPGARRRRPRRRARSRPSCAGS